MFKITCSNLKFYSFNLIKSYRVLRDIIDMVRYSKLIQNSSDIIF